MVGIMLITLHALLQFIAIALWDKLGITKGHSNRRARILISETMLFTVPYNPLSVPLKGLCLNAINNIPSVAASQLLAMVGSAPLQTQALSIHPFVRDFCLYMKYVEKKKRFKMPSFWTETHKPVRRKWGYLFDTVLLIQ